MKRMEMSKKMLLVVYREVGIQLMENIRDFFNTKYKSSQRYYAIWILRDSGRFEMLTYIRFKHFLNVKAYPKIFEIASKNN